ncbi:Ubiquinol oxidase [Musa troglodytarum]|uniref:Ubiquinol oxidase n=1 Tax=Musa troglodytarum TaxID=320322 RepID=A0A9E7KA34_9LILI|nr:Ubiquinol oxidase [Musa troglodytarum]
MNRRVAAAALRQLGPRLFSTAAISRSAAGGPWEPTLGVSPLALSRFLSTAASIGGEGADERAGAIASASTKREEKALASYWGVAPPRLFNEDGTEWRWTCFKRRHVDEQPWDTYSSNISIDLHKHHVPTTRSASRPTSSFRQGEKALRYGCRAMMLETVAAVPGMVSGLLLHLRSLRRFEHSGGWIKALLEEAENERMHLMTFMEVSQPRWYERALVFAVQGVFFNAYFAAYLLSPKLAHRMVGYLEEEAIHSYTEYLKDLEAGKIENVPAPAIAIDYWRLPADATLKDVVTVVRADEAHHRDVNHFASDIHYQGHALRELPAPKGYRQHLAIAKRSLAHRSRV